MKKLLNILYVTTPDAYLSKEGENVVVSVEQEKKLQLPIHTLEGIVTFGRSGASPSLMNLCAKNGVGLSFHNEHGKFLARVQGPIQGNVLLRKKQYFFSEKEDISLAVSKNIILAKLCNSKNILQRFIRENSSKSDVSDVQNVCQKLDYSLKTIQDISRIDGLRGIEGEAAKSYFSIFDRLILHQKSDFFFTQRTKRPPLDNVNALLSFLYTMLAFDVQSALESVGLDPYVGFLHEDRPGRPSLALDLMEELRAYLGDMLVLSLINRKQINAKSFIKTENGAVVMEQDARKLVLEAWFKRKQEEIVHPFIQEKIKIGLIPYVQSLLLARYIRGDMEMYVPFFIK